MEKRNDPRLGENKMHSTPIGKLLFTMALPLVISMLVQALYNVVDSIYVSRISESAVTALSLAFPIQNLQIGFATGIAVGMNALLSKSLGEGNREKANRTAGNSIFLMLIAVGLFMLFGMFFAKPYYAMQSQINSILSNLELEQDPPTEPSEQGTVELQTPYFTLNYASPNAHCLRMEHREGEDYCISFYGTPEGMTEMHLYDIRLSTTDQGAIGFYTTEDGAVLYLHVENVEEYAMDDWSDSSREQMNRLMEGINDLLLALSDSEAFTYF
jgi:hypothetical protein